MIEVEVQGRRRLKPEGSSSCNDVGKFARGRPCLRLIDDAVQPVEVELPIDTSMGDSSRKPSS